MLFMGKSHILIIQHLLNADTLLSSEALASVLGITSKTVRKNIELIDSVLKNAGAAIISKPGMGYWLVVENAEEFEIFLQCFREKYCDSSRVPNYSEERVNFIIHQLLLNNGYVKSEYLANRLFISPSTFSQEIKKVKEILEGYHLQISHKSGNGLIVTGKEFHKRVAIADFHQLHEENQYSAEQDFSFPVDKKRIRDMLEQTLREKNIHVSLEGLSELCNYIMVSAYRTRRGEPVQAVAGADLILGEELDAARTLMDAFFTDQPVEELQMLAMAIASRRTIGLDDAFPIGKMRNYYFLSDEIFRYLLQFTDIDLFQNSDLRQLLSRDLRGIYIRGLMQYEVRHRPIIEAKGSSSAYELAIVASDFLCQKHGWWLSESEITILANAFAFFISEQDKKLEKQRICVISQYGKNIGRTLFCKIEKYFADFIGTVAFLEFHELYANNAAQYDLVITDIPLSKFAGLPVSVYQLQSNYSANDISRLQQFIKKRDLRIQRFLDSFVEQWFVPDLSLSSKEAVLRYAGELVSSAVTDAEDIYHMFTHRESISSGALGDNIAVISSTYPVLEETKVGLLILKKPVRWSDEIAQIVFVVLTGREQDSLLFIMDHLRYLLKNVNLICKLLGAGNLSEAKQLMGDCLHDTK